MTIDEAIEKSKELASTYRIAAKNAENIFISKLMQETKRKIYIKLAEEHEQLAEWLEELKVIKEMDLSIPQHFTKEQSDWIKKYCINRNKEFYNMAIDDFLTEICKMIVQSENNGNYRFYAVEIKQSIADLAEQLKAGGENERY